MDCIVRRVSKSWTPLSIFHTFMYLCFFRFFPHIGHCRVLSITAVLYSRSLLTCFHFERKKVKSLSRVRPFATPWTVAYQGYVGFSRQEYWSGLPFPSPGDLPDPGIEPGAPALKADALTSEPPGKHSCASPILPIHPSPHLSVLATISLPSKSGSLFLFYKQVHLHHFLRFHI